MKKTQAKRQIAKPVALGALIALALSAPLAAHAGGSPITAQAVSPTQAPLTDRLIIKYRGGVIGATTASTTSDRASLHRTAQTIAERAGLQLQLVRVGALDTHVMKLRQPLPNNDVAQLARDIMAADPSIEYAEPDRILKPMFVPNDTQYGQQWSYFETTAGINLPAAWDKATGTGIVVAVIDTGYRPHADLAANILPGYDFVADTAISNDGNARDSDASDPGDWITSAEASQSTFSGCPVSDSSWHGTHVAGTIAAVTNNGNGVAGVAFNAKVLPVRVLAKCGGYTSDIADGIIWASGGTVAGIPANPNPARVINMSLGGGGACDTTSQNAINTARSRGTVVVVAAGNENTNASNSSPASCTGVITVAAVGRNGGRASYSNFGSVVAVAAPGGSASGNPADDILSTLNAGLQGPKADSYAAYAGTSMATPHVAGVVALMLSKNPALTPDEVATKLKASTRPFPATCSQCGTGIVDASAAVDAAGGTTPPPPPTGGGDEVESNNTTTTAQSVTLGTTINGTLSSSSDTDYFKLTVPAGASFTSKLTPNASSDYDLYVYNSAKSQVGSSENGSGKVDSVTVRNSGSSASTYYVRVRYYSGGTGSTSGKYTLGIN